MRYLIRSLADAADPFQAEADVYSWFRALARAFQTDVALMLDRERPARGQPYGWRDRQPVGQRSAS